MDIEKLKIQRTKLNERFNSELYNFLDWCSKQFPWIKDFVIFRDISWGYTKLYQYKLITNWNRYVNKKYKGEILNEDKQFFLNLNKDRILSEVDEEDKQEALASFDFDNVLHFREIFQRPDFPVETEKKIFLNMQILNKLSEKFSETTEQLEALAF
jgi:hypothetical protein